MTTAARWGIALLVVLCVLVRGSYAHAQDTGTADDRLLRSDPQELIEAMEADDERNVRTSIADLEEKDIREAPASVQIITARQIQASGARDLLDVLRLVPGLSFGRDVDDVVGVGIHGNWAEEGKCLFLLNGLQLNENDFGSYSIGQRIPLDNVERIEIISGPGSVIYGGYAALGVINIITRSANGANGSQASVSTGIASDRITRTNMTVSGRQRLGRNQELTYLTGFSRGTRSNSSLLLPDGRTISFADSTLGQTVAVQFGYRWRNLQASMLYMDEASEVSDGRYSVRMRDMIAALEQRLPLSTKVELNWKLSYTDQIPWYYENTGDWDRLASNTTNQRTAASALLNVHPWEWFGFRFGVQAFNQRSQFYEREEATVFAMNGERAITMNDVALLGEVTLKGRPGILSAGYRYEYNSLSGNYLTPRASYAKVLGRFHVKLLLSKAFKTPTIMNLNYGPVDGTVHAEFATTAEAEVGYRPGKVSQVTLNAYTTKVETPIVYVFDAATLDNYINRDLSGTQGIDLRFQLGSKRTTLSLGYGIYRVLPNSSLPEAELPAPNDRAYQALPAQRATGMVA
ncbi:MAG TPA: TonB-dependent receptor plug domain-containing protein, partial [Flavobacteriales bacterium]|nr:TonB-dependent receptor plug domain-containing protein [Flavobacteriales bacterium]